MSNAFLKFININYIECLKKNDIVCPTDIQENTIPLIIDGKDVIGVSKTGTGKTLAYLLPLMTNINMEIKTPQVVILTPTHELSAQVFEQCKLLYESYTDGPFGVLLIGGSNINRQLENLKKKPRVVVGSAGRILELIKIKKLSLHNVKTIVIDEADRMLDMHNIADVNAIIKTTLRDRQLLFFSASMDAEAIKNAEELGKTPEIIKANETSAIPESIEHMYFISEQRDKIEILRKAVHSENIQKGLVFLNNADQIENMVKRLNFHKIKTDALFGTNLPKERKQVLNDFRNGKITLLIASDIAARGLDLKNLDHVINLDVPENPVFYLHRAGRTGRMGRYGKVITIATENEVQFIKKYEKKYSISIKLKKLRYGNIVD